MNTMSYDATTGCARLNYESTMTHDSSATIHHGGATNAHDASKIRYGASTIQAGSATVASRPPTNLHDLVVVLRQFAKLLHQISFSLQPLTQSVMPSTIKAAAKSEQSPDPPPRLGGGTLIFSSYVCMGPASTTLPKKYQEFQAPKIFLKF